MADKAHDSRHGNDHLTQGSGQHSHNDDVSKHIGALGGKKENHPNLDALNKDALKAKDAPILKEEQRPGFPALSNFKNRLPFGKGKGKG